MLNKKVILFDGVPQSYSFDIACHVAQNGHKILAVDKSGGKIEPEFVKLVRKNGGDGIHITPSESSVKGLNDMLDMGLSRYGRINELFFFRHFKDVTKADFELTKEKFVKTLLNFRQVYGDFLFKKNLETKARLFVTSTGELEHDFMTESVFNSIFEGLSPQFTSFHYLGNGAKSHPLQLDNVESIKIAHKLIDDMLWA